MQNYGPQMRSNIRKTTGRHSDTEITSQVSSQELARTYCNEMLNAHQNLKYLAQRGYVEMNVLILRSLCIAGTLG